MPTAEVLDLPQTHDGDEPGTAIGYALYHPDHGFYETRVGGGPSERPDGVDTPPDSDLAIALFRHRDMTAAERLHRGWSDKAVIIPTTIPVPPSALAAEQQETHDGQ